MNWSLKRSPQERRLEDEPDRCRPPRDGLELSMRSTEPGFFRKLELPDGVTITHVLQESLENPDEPRIFMLYPGGAPPRFGVQLMNRRNVERIVRVDPITGVPRVEQPQ